MPKYFLFLLLLLLTNCAESGPPPLPPEVDYLVPVVTELQLAEALTGEIPVMVRDSIRDVFYDQTLADHGMDRERFDSLLWVVRAEPVWIDSLYSRVGTELARRSAEKVEKGEKGEE